MLLSNYINIKKVFYKKAEYIIKNDYMIKSYQEIDKIAIAFIINKNII